MPNGPAADTFDPDLLADGETPSAAVERLKTRLFQRALAIIDRRLEKERLAHCSAEVIEPIIGGLFNVAELRGLANQYQPEEGRTWENFVLQQVHWRVQSALRRLRRESLSEMPYGEDPPPAHRPSSAGTGLWPAMAEKVDRLPMGQRSVWTLRCAPVFDPRETDRECMAEHSGKNRTTLDPEIDQLIVRVHQSAVDREETLELALKLAKIRRAMSRRDAIRKALLGLGVSDSELFAIEHAADLGKWTAEEAAFRWKDHVHRTVIDEKGVDRLFDEFAVVTQQARKLSEVIRSTQAEVARNDQQLLIDHADVAATLGETRSNSQKLFSRANASLGLEKPVSD